MTFPVRPSAVVFDMDGLLFDTERLYLDAMTQTLAGYGYRMEAAFYQTMLGQPWQAIQERLVGRYGADLPVDDIRNTWRKQFAILCEDQLVLKVGALELLDLLDSFGMPYAVATSSPRFRVEEHFSRYALTSRFRHIVAQEDYSRGKPYPDPYLTAASRLGISPQLCLALEDSQNGVRSAAAAGMMTIMVPDLVEPSEDVAALCLSVSRSLHEVHSLLSAATDS
jgi:HAD superfamily hydrolase (TIGR01509 family)